MFAGFVRQFNMAKLIPGKEEFYETLRYFSKKVELTGVDLRLNTKVDASSLLDSSDPDNAFDAVILATGVLPRKLTFEGFDHPKVIVACMLRVLCVHVYVPVRYCRLHGYPPLLPRVRGRVYAVCSITCTCEPQAWPAWNVDVASVGRKENTIIERYFLRNTCVRV